MSSCHYRVHGRVQGVGFRFFTRRAASELGLTGWVRNLPDGTVEAVAYGSGEAILAFSKKLGRGPVGARVDKLDQKPLGDDSTFDAFEIK